MGKGRAHVGHRSCQKIRRRLMRWVREREKASTQASKQEKDRCQKDQVYDRDKSERGYQEKQMTEREKTERDCREIHNKEKWVIER